MQGILGPMRRGRVMPGVLALSFLVACSNTTGSLPCPCRQGTQTPARVLTAFLDALGQVTARARALGTSTFVPGNGELCGRLTVGANTPFGTAADARDGEVIFSTVLTTEGGVTPCRTATTSSSTP